MNRHVYVAESGDFAKIGYSKQPNVRVHQLAYQPARLRFVIRTLVPRDVEQLALAYLSAHRVEGEEYFDCGSRLCIAAVKCAALELGLGYEVLVDIDPLRWCLPVDKWACPNPARLLDS